MKLNGQFAGQSAQWQAAGVQLPSFDWQKMHDATVEAPVWLHFGAGNIFRGFIARLQNSLLSQGLTDRGIIAAETFDTEIIDKIYDPFDSASLLVTLMADGDMKKEIVASIACGLRANSGFPADMAALTKVFCSPSLQMVSYTITEKGYALNDSKGQFLPLAQRDFENGPQGCAHAMSITAALLLERFRCGGQPIAMVSMDNCSANGQKLRSGVMTVAQQWLANGFVTEAFLTWLGDESKVSFPWTMIDKITPRPAAEVAKLLEELGVEDMQPIITEKRTFIAPFVNAEGPQYLVVEDRFPNGRPPLEKAGVYMTDRDTVNKTERMKVMTCLNPLHTALAVYGCLLGYEKIADEMEDPLLRTLVERIGRVEGMPVVTDPGIISPEAFLDEVLNQRLPNSFLPDSPQRIATDTSQKVGIRFGETLRSYAERSDLDAAKLVCIPLVAAGWFRYLLGVDDAGKPMACSADPLLPELQAQLASVQYDAPDSLGDALVPLLTNTELWGCDLAALGLGETIQRMMKQMLGGVGAVRNTLESWLNN